MHCFQGLIFFCYVYVAKVANFLKTLLGIIGTYRLYFDYSIKMESY